MKSIIFFVLISFVCVQGVKSQTESQQVADIDKIVYEIKNHLNDCRKIKDPLDTPTVRSNIIETAYKKGNSLALVQYRDSGGHAKSTDWYFYQNHLIYSTTTYKDNTNEYCYYKNNKLIKWVRNDKLVTDKNTQEYKQMENVSYTADSVLVKRYADK